MPYKSIFKFKPYVASSRRLTRPKLTYRNRPFSYAYTNRFRNTSFRRTVNPLDRMRNLNRLTARNTISRFLMRKNPQIRRMRTFRRNMMRTPSARPRVYSNPYLKNRR